MEWCEHNVKDCKSVEHRSENNYKLFENFGNIEKLTLKMPQKWFEKLEMK